MARTIFGAVVVASLALPAFAQDPAQKVTVLSIRSQEPVDDEGMVVLVLQSGARVQVPEGDINSRVTAMVNQVLQIPPTPQTTEAAPPSPPSPRPQRQEEPEYRVEIVAVESSVTERNPTWWRYAWRLTVRNNDSQPHRINATIEFQDAGGFIVDSNDAYGLAIEAGATKTFTGFALVNAAVAGNITQAAAKADFAAF